MRLKILHETPTSITFEVPPGFFRALIRERLHRLALEAARRRRWPS